MYSSALVGNRSVVDDVVAIKPKSVYNVIKNVYTCKFVPVLGLYE